MDPRILDKRWRINHLYKIIDKHGNLITFKCNDEQTYLFNKYQKHKQENQVTGLREQNLKARQIGFTTFHCIYYLDEILFNRNRHARVVAHKQKLLNEIFEKIDIAYKYLPDMFKMKTKNETAHKISFEESNSSISITLDCRGETVQHLHVAEMAFIKNPKNFKAGSFKAVPKSGDITIETTANGVGNDFHNSWKNPRQWNNNFFSWLDHKDYITPLVEGEVITGAHDDYLDEIGATPEQRKWWYFELSELSGDLDLMLQENPARPEDAFISSGRPVMPNIKFDTLEPERVEITPDKMIDRFFEPVDGMEITKEQAVKLGMEIDDVLEFHVEPSAKAPLRVWKRPEDGKMYCIGGDVAEGLAKGDYSCGYVLCIDDFEIVAKWHGHTAPDEFGVELVKLARWYNNAEIGVEVNNHGLATLNKIKSIYDNIYFRENYDEIADNMTRKIGWQTNLKTKPLMISELHESLRDKLLKVHDEELQGEVATFVYDDNGSMNATEGCYDDRVIAAAIVIQVYKSIA